MKWIIVGLLATCLIFGCVSDSGQYGIQTFEQMSEIDFNINKQELQIVTSIATRNAFKNGRVSEESVLNVADRLESLMTQPVTPELSKLIQQSLGDGLESQDLADLLSIASLELQRRGGIVVRTNPDGTLAISERTKAIILAVAQGLRDGIK